jgi:hypothetical protein
MIPRSQIITCLRREAGWEFEDQTKRVEIYRRGTDRLVIPKRSGFTPDEAAAILRMGGIAQPKIEEFLKTSLKGSDGPA